MAMYYLAMCYPSKSSATHLVATYYLALGYSFRTGQRCSFEIEHINVVFQTHKTFVMTIYVSCQTHKL